MSELVSKYFKYPILITGGAGFLGSHMVALCLEKKVDVVVIDNLSNSDLKNLRILEKHFNMPIPFFKIDIRNKDKLNQFFKELKFSAVIHFAGLKSVTESIVNPDLYYENNVQGSQYLIDSIKSQGIKKVIFSSSASVYGEPQYFPIDEEHPIQPMNPYGETKAQVEKLFVQDSYFNTASVILLRYFNPVGSYKGLIGEKPNGIPNNLMPYILGVARGEYNHLNIYGDNYHTKDGTGVRDYIHVMDLISAHWAALIYESVGSQVYNVGTGKGVSVKAMIKAFEIINKINIPYQIKPRRPGDIAACYAAVVRIKKHLHWSAKLNLQDMCRDAWSVNY